MHNIYLIIIQDAKILYKLKELAVGTDDKPIVQSHENKI